MTECLYQNWTADLTRVIRNLTNKKFAFSWPLDYFFPLRFKKQCTWKDRRFKLSSVQFLEFFTVFIILWRVSSIPGEVRWYLKSLPISSPRRITETFLTYKGSLRNQVTKSISLLVLTSVPLNCIWTGSSFVLCSFPKNFNWHLLTLILFMATFTIPVYM